MTEGRAQTLKILQLHFKRSEHVWFRKQDVLDEIKQFRLTPLRPIPTATSLKETRTKGFRVK